VEAGPDTERGPDDGDSEPELFGLSRREPRVGEDHERDLLAEQRVLVEHGVDGDPEHERREEVEEPREDAGEDTDGDLREVVATVREEQSFHRVLDLVPLFLEGVVVLPFGATHYRSISYRAANRFPSNRNISAEISGNGRWNG